jgi:hypothetical protein
MTFFDNFRTAFDNIDALRSVHHNVAKLKAAREVARQAFGLPSLKSKRGRRERARRAMALLPWRLEFLPRHQAIVDAHECHTIKEIITDPLTGHRIFAEAQPD